MLALAEGARGHRVVALQPTKCTCFTRAERSSGVTSGGLVVASSSDADMKTSASSVWLAAMSTCSLDIVGLTPSWISPTCMQYHGFEFRHPCKVFVLYEVQAWQQNCITMLSSMVLL